LFKIILKIFELSNKSINLGSLSIAIFIEYTQARNISDEFVSEYFNISPKTGFDNLYLSSLL